MNTESKNIKKEERYSHGQPFHSDVFVYKNNDIIHTTAGGAARQMGINVGGGLSSVERSNGTWLRHGENDNTPNLLRDYYKNVAINKRAIQFKANSIKADGLMFECIEDRFAFNVKKDEFESVSKKFSDSDKETEIKKAELWAKNIGLNSFHNKFSQQIALHGGCFAKSLNYSSPRAEKTTQKIIAQSPVIGRLGAEYDMFSEQSKEHYFSDNFAGGQYVIKKKIVTYQEYVNLSDKDKKKGGYIVKVETIDKAKRKPIESHYIGNITADRENYATPDYETTEYSYYSDIVLEKAKYNHSDIKRNLGLTKIITIFRKKENSEKKELERRQLENDNWKNKLRGSENQGMFIIDRVEPSVDKSGKPILESSFLINEVPQNDTTSRYKSLEESANVILLTCHGIIDPRIAGIPNLGSSGLSSQMDFFVAAIEQMDNDVIKTYSDLECDFLTELAQRDGLSVKVKRKKTLPLYRAMVSDLMSLVLDDDEIRSIYGFAPMTVKQREQLAQRLLNKTKTIK